MLKTSITVTPNSIPIISRNYCQTYFLPGYGNDSTDNLERKQEKGCSYRL
uniref:Uncharacterized protein n=1 Tax=Arundo donax TaxID=35708 RepID=A0A0A9CTE0_ARUDO